MRAATLATAALLSGFALVPPPALQVLRVSPTDAGEPTSSITVTFDRPVAGQLDGTVDARRIFSILPAVAGKVEWRDPITLRFTPAAPLRAGASYTVTVANTFAAMDGSRLERPYRFTFRIGGPRVLIAGPANPRLDRRFLQTSAEFALVVSAPVSLPLVGTRVQLNLARTCGAPSPVALRAVSQRAITTRDPDSYKEAGGWQRDRKHDALRRVVRLTPVQPLPSGCDFALVAPERIDAARGTMHSWPMATYGPLRLVSVTCTSDPVCPAGWARVKFSTPVRGTAVLRAVRISAPAATPFTLSDSTDDAPAWALEVALRPRATYTVSVDTTLRDIFGQRLETPQQGTITTTGYEPNLDYASGSVLVEREGFRTIPVKHVNVDTIFASFAPVPESLEARVLAAPAWNIGDVLPLLAAGTTVRAIPVRGPSDVPLVSAVRVPAYNAARDGTPTLTAIRMSRSRADTSHNRGVVLTQVTNLAVAARLGAEEAVVWVTRVNDGRAVAGAEVVLYNKHGQVRSRGTTDAQGLVRLSALPADTTQDKEDSGLNDFEGYVAANFESDRALVPFNSYAWELNPWRFNVYAADDADRIPAAAAVFTERGIYRPGETVYAKAIVRTGNLGSLRVPARRDSLRWVFSDREQGTIRDTIVTVSSFGTADQALRIPTDLALGTYRVAVQLRRQGSWTELSSAFYRVAEYRPPEFLVGVTADTIPHFAGDSVTARVEARYLFGAPMGHAVVSWMIRRTVIDAWALSIPGVEGYQVGETGWWWEDSAESSPSGEVAASGTDTLDAAGTFDLRVALGAAKKGRPARVTAQATVTDVNRQAVSASATVTMHPAAFYVAAKPTGDEYFWRANTPQDIAVVAVTPTGTPVPNVAVRGTLVRQEWHRVQRERGGLAEEVGGWVPDTLAHCDVTTTDAFASPATCRFTPPQGGSYIVSFRARDAAGRVASTSFYRWATGRGWVPWGDETQLKMDLIPDKTRYDVGDTATVLIASPFTDAEAWVTVEREGVIEQRRLRLTSGATSLKFVMTEAHVPNVFVSAVVVRGRSAAPGGINDPGRPALRVGYTELRVTPRVKRLAVTVQSLAAEYRPADSARVRLSVRDAGGTGRRSEVTLWAVDEGVLSLTAYRTPDPVDLIYRPRGVAMRLRSDLVNVAAQVLAEEGVSIKGEQEPGGGGGQGGSDILRSRFSSTAFFLGSVVTDSAGEATATAKLPDNLTTFRLMAVAVTAGDRYGSGQSSMLVTRPLLARPALPRFLRLGDHFVAGVVVNQRSGAASTVRVQAGARGVVMSDSASRSATLEPGRGREVRFAFRDTTADTASFRFDVTNGRDSDAVLTRLPVRPSHVPRAWTAAGVVRTASPVELTLPADIDPDRSELVFGIGTTPLAIINGMYQQLAIYPFDCTEQIASELMPIVALYRAGNAPGAQRLAPADARARIEEAVAVLSRRQRADGGIGLWSADDWTTPWLSAWAGEALLAAKGAGIAVRDSVLGRLGDFLYRNVHQNTGLHGPVAAWLDDQQIKLGEDVASLDYLRQLGRPDVAGENDALRRAGILAWEDRARLAELMANRGDLPAARRLIEPLWAGVRVEGRRASLPDSSARRFYFWSPRRPLARLLTATLAVDSAHTLVGPMVETLVEQARANRWNTQDYGAAVQALADFTARQQRAARRGVTVTAGGQEIYRSQGQGDVMRETSRNLAGILTTGADGAKRLSLNVTAQAPGQALYYYVTVNEVPLQRPVTPDQRGIEVERWYEDFTTGRPIQSAVEGSLVRVRLRIRFTTERRFLALTDPLPAGLEAVDLSLRTTGALPGPAAAPRVDEGEGDDSEQQMSEDGEYRYGWYYGSWDSGWWSPFDHRELHDDRVAWVATYLWPGTYTATYVARATTPGVFIRPPAHAEEMYNPAVRGRSDGGTFTVTPTP